MRFLADCLLAWSPRDYAPACSRQSNAAEPNALGEIHARILAGNADIPGRKASSAMETEKMLHGLTVSAHGISLRPGHALRLTAIAFGSAVLIAALTLELFAIAILAR
jgi:hypothetical protein